jgi:hypothetical protein
MAIHCDLFIPGSQMVLSEQFIQPEGSDRF